MTGARLSCALISTTSNSPKDRDSGAGVIKPLTLD
jgi:hypothetical protein